MSTTGTPTDLADRAARERALLARRPRRAARPPLLERAADGTLSTPASPAQRLFHGLQEAYPGQPGFNQSGAARLRGPLDVPRLERALAELIGRHEALRTVFETRDGVLHQVVRAAEAPAVPVRDTAEADARALAGEFVARPFDLAAELPVRLAVLRLAAEDHIVLFALHHIVGDLHSVEILFRELYTLHLSGLGAKEAVLAGLLDPLTAQTADVTAWQQAALTGPREAELHAYWRARTAGAAAVELPSDTTRAVPPSTAGHVVVRPVPARVAAGVKALADAHRASEFITTLAAFAIVLARRTGRRDLVLSTPVTRRDRQETARLIGAHLNYVPLRVRIDGSLGFGAHLDAVRAEVTADLAHDDLPYEEIAGLAGLTTGQLFRVLFQRDEDPETVFPEGELSGELWDAPWEHALNDLTVRVSSSPAGWYLYVNHRTDVLSPALGTAIADEFLALLGDLADDADRRVGELLTVRAA
ncbi:condensation domain-containing protein [Kitasatospora sp. NPDC096147]|uniref:condensation domain-containing protein n=1 Tax=Kitasatospora sp. NPDC096147 TaxID=3364093 RepID=UPI0038306810